MYLFFPSSGVERSLSFCFVSAPTHYGTKGTAGEERGR